jgi:uncharacterized protein YceH (UPF0502 family)
MNLDENQVREALSGLEAMGLAGPASSADSRVTKYEHHLQDVFNFSRGETAVICVLLLRGPQTLGELRGRTERLHRFEDLEAVQAALQHLMRREPALAAMLPRQPGTKESRYAHLLSGEIPVAAPALRGVAAPVDHGQQDRVSRLEEQVATLEGEVSDLKQTVEALRKQFE